MFKKLFVVLFLVITVAVPKDLSVAREEPCEICYKFYSTSCGLAAGYGGPTVVPWPDLHLQGSQCSPLEPCLFGDCNLPADETHSSVSEDSWSEVHSAPTPAGHDEPGFGIVPRHGIRCLWRESCTGCVYTSSGLEQRCAKEWTVLVEVPRARLCSPSVACTGVGPEIEE
jgi:hypothetical protein